MRVPLLLAGMWLASLAHAAGLDGTWVFQGPNGELIARIEVKGSALAGSIEIDGQSLIQLKGSAKGNYGRGDASFASEEYLAFRADGTYLYGKGRSVAGGGNWSWDGGNGAGEERGRWRAADGVLYVLGQKSQWARVGTYGMTEDGTTMRITYDGGGRKLWSRQ